MRIIFAGTPELAVPTLEALIQQHEVCAVYTQPDRPAGRGRALTPSPVKQCALTHHLPVFQPKTLRDVDAQTLLKSHQADVMVVLAYGLILPAVVLNTPRYGCINVHLSLLPRWRGASPLQQAIWAGDETTGISIMQMDQGLDTGPVYVREICSIEPHDTAQTLGERLAALSPAVLLSILARLASGGLKPEPQDSTCASYAPKISKADALLKWTQSAAYLERQIRALNPWPVAFCGLNGEAVRIWEAGVAPHVDAVPGTIVHVHSDAVDVATAQGVLRIKKLQCPGARAMTVREILNGKPGFFKKGDAAIIPA